MSASRSTRRWSRWLPPLTGLAALIWFLVRVVPRPARAAYPCQRAAAPVAGGFLLWLGGLVGSTVIWRRARRHRRASRVGAAAACSAMAVLLAAQGLFLSPDLPALAADHLPNDPLGTALGVHPGRVVWIHSPAATDWDGPGDGHWWEPTHTLQAEVDEMVSRAVQRLAGEETDAAAWDAMIRWFNQTHGRGDVGYTPGERIVIKTNFVGAHYLWGGIDPEIYDLINLDYMNTSPRVILALLRQLVNVVGVAPADIGVGDPNGLWPNQYFDLCAGEFPDVRYLDHDGGGPGHPRTAFTNSTVELHWSTHPAGVTPDFIPQSFVDATYLINLANLKSHSMAGITLCGKNHYGSLIRWPAQDGYFDMHPSLAQDTPDEGRYRAVVDLLGHAQLGGKTLLGVVDGLYAGCHPYDDAPIRWDAPPFHGDWTSSLLMSQDVIALDSVGFDLLQLEGDPRAYPQRAGADDYLHEAAQADDPPSGAFYDPDHAGDVTRLASLGVHEHWDDATTMRYSRNLGSGDGIELVREGIPTSAPPGRGRGGLALAVYPNPFNPATAIHYELSEAGPVRLRIHAADGRLVRTLEDGWREAGPHAGRWDGRDDAGRPAASGVYLATAESRTTRQSARLTLVR